MIGREGGGGNLYVDLWQKTDQKLVALCCKGHGPAWESLVHRYKRLVYHFPHQANLKPEDCDEIFQETFLALHRSLDKLADTPDLSGWISTVAQRTTWKWVNLNRRHPEEQLPEAYDCADPDEIPAEYAERKLQQAKIRLALKRLPQTCRKLLHLLFYVYDSADYDHVAIEAGISRGSVGPMRKRCLAKFKEKLATLGIHQKNVSKWLK